MEKKYDVEGFLKEIIDVYKKYNISIGHEDCQGAFILEPYDEYDVNWLKECSVDLNGKHYFSVEKYLKDKESYELFNRT